MGAICSRPETYVEELVVCGGRARGSRARISLLSVLCTGRVAMLTVTISIWIRRGGRALTSFRKRVRTLRRRPDGRRCSDIRSSHFELGVSIYAKKNNKRNRSSVINICTARSGYDAFQPREGGMGVSLDSCSML